MVPKIKLQAAQVQFFGYSAKVHRVFLKRIIIEKITCANMGKAKYYRSIDIFSKLADNTLHTGSKFNVHKTSDLFLRSIDLNAMKTTKYCQMVNCLQISQPDHFCKYHSEVYSETSRILEIKLFAEIDNDFQTLTKFMKRSILEV